MGGGDVEDSEERVAGFSKEEQALMADTRVFLLRASVREKIRAQLEELHQQLTVSLSGATLLTPPGFDPAKCQFVKGEHLEQFPYQYLDFPKHFMNGDIFTYRSLFWWGHHVVFALLLEGGRLRQYKANVINRYRAVANRDLHVSLGSSLWEWRQGAGYTLPVTPDRRAEISAVLANRPFFKLARFVPLTDPAVSEGRLAEMGRATWESLLPVVTP